LLEPRKAESRENTRRAITLILRAFLRVFWEYNAFPDHNIVYAWDQKPKDFFLAKTPSTQRFSWVLDGYRADRA